MAVYRVSLCHLAGARTHHRHSGQHSQPPRSKSQSALAYSTANEAEGQEEGTPNHTSHEPHRADSHRVQSHHRDSLACLSFNLSCSLHCAARV